MTQWLSRLGSEGGGILIDALHVQRCGTDWGSWRAVDPGLLSYLQLCDAPLVPAACRRCCGRPGCGDRDAVLEARAARLLPGEGELPLSELLAALPTGSGRGRRPRIGRAGARELGRAARSSRRGRGRRWTRFWSPA